MFNVFTQQIQQAQKYETVIRTGSWDTVESGKKREKIFNHFSAE
jgi:hypothetical protein